MILLILFTLIYFAIVFKGFVIVKQHEAVIVERFGKHTKTLTAGLHWTIPFIESTHPMIKLGNKIVKVIEPVTKTSGAVTMYEERWEARLYGDSFVEIPAGSDARIVSNDSIILYVEEV